MNEQWQALAKQTADLHEQLAAERRLRMKTQAELIALQTQFDTHILLSDALLTAALRQRTKLRAATQELARLRNPTTNKKENT